MTCLMFTFCSKHVIASEYRETGSSWSPSIITFCPTWKFDFLLAWVITWSKDQLQILTNSQDFFWGGAEFFGGCVCWFVWKANENGHYDLVQVMERLWKSHQKHLGKTTSFQSNLGMLPWDAEAKEGRWHRVDLKPSLWGWKDGRVGIYFRSCWSKYEGRREFFMNHSG